jgi:uracil-DNA glycosylase family 4
MNGITLEQPELNGIFEDQLKVPDVCLLQRAHDQVKQSIIHCQLCPSNKLTKPLSLHNFDARIMVIGEKPEDVLLDTKQGSLLAKLVRHHGVDLEDVYMTSLTKCQESEHPTNCQSHLVAELVAIRPMVAICFGYQASAVFLPNPQLGQYTQVYPNVHVLPMHSLQECLSDTTGQMQQMIDSHFSYICRKIQEMKSA